MYVYTYICIYIHNIIHTYIHTYIHIYNILGDGETYVDPGTKKPRTVPLELFYKTDSEPSYGITSDDDLRATETMALPFQAYGALGILCYYFIMLLCYYVICICLLMPFSYPNTMLYVVCRMSFNAFFIP
jgi:hypothetical protein